MNFFEYLIIGHLVGDFLFQTSWMARNKPKNLLALTAHSSVYTLFIGLACLWAGRFSYAALAIAFVSHMFLDNRTFIYFWLSKVNGSRDIPWLEIMIDQTWHFVVLAVIATYF